MKRLLPVALVLLLLASAVLAVLWHQYREFLATPLKIDSPGLAFMVEPGTNMHSVVSELEQQGVTRMDWRWRLLTRLRGTIIKAGEYELSPGLSPPGLMALLASGKVIPYRFTVVEGWTVAQLVTALGADPVLRHEIADAGDLDGLEGMPPGSAEGWFLPETYVFVRGDSDRQILQRAYRDMQEALDNAWRGRDTGLPYETPYELLIMASIIEKETSLESERADIAGVFVRRLLRHWRLETDPTVIYGMGEAYQGDIRRRDLKLDTPYNTYTRHGLPPTPIALPGQASLQAAAHPAAGDAMFFVANGQGGHTFSSTLEEHNEAVKQLIRQAREEPSGSGSRE